MLPVPPSCASIATRLVSKNLFRFTSPRYTLCTLSGSEAGRRAGGGPELPGLASSGLHWHHRRPDRPPAGSQFTRLVNHLEGRSSFLQLVQRGRGQQLTRRMEAKAGQD